MFFCLFFCKYMFLMLGLVQQPIVFTSVPHSLVFLRKKNNKKNNMASTLNKIHIWNKDSMVKHNCTCIVQETHCPVKSVEETFKYSSLNVNQAIKKLMLLKLLHTIWKTREIMLLLLLLLF